MEKLAKVFVYGTLRPDIIAEWSDLIHKNLNFTFRYYLAHLPCSKLYFHKTVGYPVCVYDPNIFAKEYTTLGYILETDNIEAALIILDEIEEYPDVYDRIKVKCFNSDSNDHEEVYFYTLKEIKEIDDEYIDIGVNDWKLYK